MKKSIQSASNILTDVEKQAEDFVPNCDGIMALNHLRATSIPIQKFDKNLPPYLSYIPSYTPCFFRKKIPYRAFCQWRNNKTKKFNYTTKKKRCDNCGQSAHSTFFCPEQAITHKNLNSSDPRDHDMIQIIHGLPKIPLLKPPSMDQLPLWLKEVALPTLLQQEKDFEKLIRASSKTKGWNFDTYLKKFDNNFSKQYSGLGAAWALGISKNVILRKLFGWRRCNEFKLDPYETIQNRSPEEEKMIHESHIKKVSEGKMLEVPASFPLGIVPEIVSKETDKNRVVADARTENLAHPDRPVKLAEPTDLLYYSKNSQSIKYDLSSAFDQILIRPIDTRWFCSTSFDDEGNQHYYAPTGSKQGVEKCPEILPNGCQRPIKTSFSLGRDGFCLHG